MRKLTILFLALTLCLGLWAETIPNNQLWYTTSDGQAVTFHGSYLFNVPVTTNTYENGKGVITFDGDLVKIGQAVFYQSKLTSVTFPASLRTIGTGAFNECAELTEINLNEGLDTIGASAFSGCTALEEVSIPASVRALVNSCFHNCKNLTTVYVNWTETNQIPIEDNRSLPQPEVPFVDHLAFMDIACQAELDCGRKYATLYVPVGTENLYYSSSFWNKFGTIKEDLDNVKPAAIAAINAAKQGVTNAHIIAIAEDAIEAINAATSSLRIEGVETQALADIAHAKAILDELPTDPEGTAGYTVTITKGDQTLTLVNPDKVTYGKQE